MCLSVGDSVHRTLTSFLYLWIVPLCCPSFCWLVIYLLKNGFYIVPYYLLRNVFGFSNPCVSWCTRLSCDINGDRRDIWYDKNYWIMIIMSLMFQILLWWMLLYSHKLYHFSCFIALCLHCFGTLRPYF